MKTKRKSTTAVKEGQEFAKASKAGEIPAELRLPDSVEAIERGRKPKLRQLDLLVDDSAMAKLRAIKRDERTQTEDRHFGADRRQE